MRRPSRRSRLSLPAAARVLLGALVLLGVPAGPAAAQAVLHVDADAPPGGDGASWASAFHDLQDALAIAQAGDEVWVAEGVYKPTMGSDREATFAMRSGVALYGGFDGTEQHRDERDWAANVTVLSGDIGGSSFTNSFHVITASGADSTAVLDGLVIESGSAYPENPPDDRGGGLLVVGGSPTIRNSLFRDNVAYEAGGGAYFEGGSPLVEDTVFEDNTSRRGGGLHASGGAPVLRRVVFRRNGLGALYFADGSAGLVEDALFEQQEVHVVILASSPVFRRSVIRDNVVGEVNPNCVGALIWDGSPRFEDCLFENLRTRHDLAGGGGAVYFRWSEGLSRPAFVRTTFRGNTANAGGGGGLQPSDALFLFCHFEGNRALGGAGLDGYQAAVTVIGSTFVGNRAETPASGCCGLGGGARLSFAPLLGGRSFIASTLFAGNTARRGGAVALQAAGPLAADLVNVTFAGNEASEFGGAVQLFNAGDVRLHNTILWGNAAPEGPEVHVTSGAGPTVERAIIEGGCPLGATCTGVLGEDPLFERMPSPGPDGEWGTDDDDYGDLRLRPGSPGIDGGLASLLPLDRWDLDMDGDTTEVLPIDVVGNPRVQGEEVDLGAYEHAPVVASEPGAGEASLGLSVRPNPARGAATVVLTLPQPGEVRVALHDVLGRRLALLHEGPLGAGRHELALDGASLPTGVYVVRVSARETVRTARLTVVR